MYQLLYHQWGHQWRLIWHVVEDVVLGMGVDQGVHYVVGQHVAEDLVAEYVVLEDQFAVGLQELVVDQHIVVDVSQE
jgi:hypothetical protein